MHFLHLQLFAFHAIGKTIARANQKMEVVMTTTENYVYQFDSVLDPVANAHSVTDLLSSLCLKIPRGSDCWSKLVRLVTQRQDNGYDFNRGRASLALLCQHFLNPQKKQFTVSSFGLVPNDDNPQKTDLIIQFREDGLERSYQEIVHSKVEIALPHILKKGLQDSGTFGALDSIRVEDGKHTQLIGTTVRHQSLLYFHDRDRGLGWWCVGVSKSPLVAICEASVAGYQFALDSRRNSYPINEHSATWRHIEDYKRQNPREYRKSGVCFGLIF